MNSPVLSICIPAYNQSELLRDCLSKLIAYEGDDIEIVVNDDCSPEDIQKIVSACHDERVKYYRNSINLGHDLNILQSFRNAKAQHAFLLRARDCLIPSAIHSIVERIKQNPHLAYLIGSAVDEKGKKRLTYRKDSQYPKGEKAIDAHLQLLVHPSGSLYAIHLLDLDRIEKFMVSQFSHTYGFVIHTLIRLELAICGDFEILSDVIWQYTHTLRATDVAVNSTKTKESVYSPRLSFERFTAEMKWAHLILPPQYVMRVYTSVSKSYLTSVTWEFAQINEDPYIHQHYNTAKVSFSMHEERDKFVNLAKSIAMECIEDPKTRREYFHYLRNLILKNKLYCFKYSMRHAIVTTLKKSKLIRSLYSKIKSRLSNS
jgi:glycosyltransferase involved in cell wall biosynthesis